MRNHVLRSFISRRDRKVRSRNPSKNLVSAQMLYDMREVTGFVSGTELREIFRLVCEESCPSGAQYFWGHTLPEYVRDEMMKTCTVEILRLYYCDCVAGEQFRPSDIRVSMSEAQFVNCRRWIGKPMMYVASEIREAGERILKSKT